MPDSDYQPLQAHRSEVPTGLATAAEMGAEELGNATHPSTPVKMKASQMLTLFLAQATLYIAFVAPSAFSLAVRIQTIAPESKDTVLAVAIGIPGVVALFIAPIIGVLSDRTRSRLGRRRPWLLLGVTLGLIGSATIGLSPVVGVLILGWTIAFIGYTITSVMILAYLGDRLPESQRGKVAGINGAVTQIASILGIVVAGAFVASPALMFIIPGALAFIGCLVFIIVMKDPGVSEARSALRIGELFQGFWFNPRRFPNLGWVWLSKALVFVALAFMQLYSVYLLSAKLGMDAAGVAGLVAAAGIIGVVTAIVGALGSGFLSDKLGTRKPFLVVSALSLAAGLIVVGTVSSTTQYLIGSLLASLSIGVYGSVDQAIQLDVLPQEENQNGRFLSTLNLANQAPQAFGPFAAAAVLSLAGGDYSWVYFAAAVFAVLGALAIIPVSVGKRATLSTTSTAIIR